MNDIKIKVLINDIFPDHHNESINTILSIWMKQVKINKRNKLYDEAYSIVCFLKNEGKSKYKVVTDSEGINYLITTSDFNEAIEKAVKEDKERWNKLASCNTIEELSNLFI